MNTFVSILKIASAVLFTLLLIPSGKIFVPMYLVLLAGFVIPYNIGVIALSLLVLCVLILLVTFSFRNTNSHDRVCLFTLLLLYIPVAATITSAFESNNAECLRSYFTFISVSLAAIILTGVRMIQNQYADHSSISKPFRKWISRVLTEAEVPQ